MTDERHFEHDAMPPERGRGGPGEAVGWGFHPTHRPGEFVAVTEGPVRLEHLSALGAAGYAPTRFVPLGVDRIQVLVERVALMAGEDSAATNHRHNHE